MLCVRRLGFRDVPGSERERKRSWVGIAGREIVGPQPESEPEGSESKMKGEVSRSKADCGLVVGSRSGASCDGPRTLDRRVNVRRARRGQVGRCLVHDSIVTSTFFMGLVSIRVLALDHSINVVFLRDVCQVDMIILYSHSLSHEIS